MRTQVPIAIAFVMGLGMVIRFFVPTHRSEDLEELALKWAQIIGAFALIVGIGSLLKTNLDKVSRRSERFGYAVVTLVGFFAMSAIGILGDPNPKQAESWRGACDRGFDWLFNNVQVPMDATIFSLLAFFMASAAYRTFRARTFEAGLLLAAAVIVMLGRVPLGVQMGEAVQQALHLPLAGDWLASLTEWILKCPNLAAKRAILFGAALAAVAQALRIIVGIERPYMSGS